MTWDDAQLDTFARSYVWAAVESNRDRLHEEGADVGRDLLDQVDNTFTRPLLTRQAREFVAAHAADLATWLDPDHAGYDLWMTRAGEGVGFSARYLPNDPGEMFSAHALTVRRDPAQVAAFDEAMTRVSAAARALGEVNVYVGDDGLIRVE